MGIKFHLVHNQVSIDPALLYMDRDTCLTIVRDAPVSVLSVDLERWADGAKHGDVFKVNSQKHVLALDLKEFGLGTYL